MLNGWNCSWNVIAVMGRRQHTCTTPFPNQSNSFLFGVFLATTKTSKSVISSCVRARNHYGLFYDCWQAAWKAKLAKIATDAPRSSQVVSFWIDVLTFSAPEKCQFTICLTWFWFVCLRAWWFDNRVANAPWEWFLSTIGAAACSCTTC